MEERNPLPLLVAAMAADAAPLLLPQPLASMLRRVATDAVREAGVDPDLITALNMIRDVAAILAATLPLTTLAVLATLFARK